MAKSIKKETISTLISAKKKEYNDYPPLPEEERKRLFPNVPPPTMKELKENRKQNKYHL